MNTISIIHHDNLVTVPLSNSPKTATLASVDFDALMSAGISPRWKLGYDGKVRFGNNLTVARIILKAGKGQQVKYVDDDPTNLRRANLILSSCGNKLMDVEHIYDGKTSAVVAAGAIHVLKN